MSRFTKLCLVVCFFLLMVGVAQSGVALAVKDDSFVNWDKITGPPQAPMACVDGTQASGALYRICMPFLPGLSWNRDLVIYAHGYVSDQQPVAIPAEANQVANMANLLGYAFATTSYSMNGLAVQAGLEDIVDLVDVFISQRGEPDRVIIVGASEGGLITTLAVERHADIFDGGLAMCGPIGDFRGQIDHIGDFRVVFDYFFPGLLPPSPVVIPQDLIDTWDSFYSTNIKPEVENPADESQLVQLLHIMEIDFPPADLATRERTVEKLLWYNVFASNDASAKLDGQPFDNQSRRYIGSDDDLSLNKSIARFNADQTALEKIDAHYQTTGKLTIPLVTLHTTGDHLVPYWHIELYQAKVLRSDNIALNHHIEIDRYGHCTFDYQTEVLAAFNTLVDMIDNPPAYVPAPRVFIPLVVGNP